MDVSSASPKPSDVDEPPPFWGHWRRIYIAVMIYLFLLIAILAYVTDKLGTNRTLS